MRYNVVVVGGGPAGLGAAVEAKRNGVKDVLIIERDKELGGILNQCIHNGFGLHEFNEELTGPEYAHKFIQMAHDENIDIMLNTMVLNINENKTIEAMGPDGMIEIEADAVVLSMGCRERTRGAIDIPGDRPSGVYNAGAAQRLSNIDGYMVGKEVVIYGSGDIGLIMARRMTLEGAKVKAVVEVNPHSSGLTRNIVQCLNDFDIPLMLSTGITYIHGKQRVEGVTISKLDEFRNPIEGTDEFISCDTVLLSVGLIPENELSEELGVKLDYKTSGPIVNNSMNTNIDGIFACGNVVHVHDLVDFVTKESRVAGKNAAMYVQNKEAIESKMVNTVSGDGISYIVPQSINTNHFEDVNLFMRVKGVYDNKKLVVKDENNIIISKKKMKMIPSEMEIIKLSKDMLGSIQGNIIISVEEN